MSDQSVQYRVIICDCKEMQSEINGLARQGWVLHSLAFKHTGSGAACWIIVMERKVI